MWLCRQCRLCGLQSAAQCDVNGGPPLWWFTSATRFRDRVALVNHELRQLDMSLRHVTCQGQILYRFTNPIIGMILLEYKKKAGTKTRTGFGWRHAHVCMQPILFLHCTWQLLRRYVPIPALTLPCSPL